MLHENVDCGGNEMNIVKRWLCLVLAILIACALCACGGGNAGNSNTTTTATTGEKSPEELVREAVRSKGYFAYFGMSIGGNELTRSSMTITNVRKISDYEYLVSGRMVMTDVYGTKWYNTFDCTVEKNYSGSWSAGSIEYTSTMWTRG